MVLHTLMVQQSYAKFYKCEFWLNSVTFLGHIISSRGIMVDLQKAVVIKMWPRPTTPTDIRRCLGFAGCQAVEGE